MNNVALEFKGSTFTFERQLIWVTTVKTLASKHAELDLCHIEPRAMLGCVMELYSCGNPSGLRGLEGLVERGDVVGVEVVSKTTQITSA